MSSPLHGGESRPLDDLYCLIPSNGGIAEPWAIKPVAAPEPVEQQEAEEKRPLWFYARPMSLDEVAAWARQVVIDQTSGKYGEHCPVLPGLKLPVPGNILRAADPRYWRRVATRGLRIAHEAQELARGDIGKHGKFKYSGATAKEWDAQKQVALATWLATATVYDHENQKMISVAEVLEKPEHRAWQAYATLKAVEALAREADLHWLMLTITLPGEWHAAPANKGGKNAKWNGATPDMAHKVISTGWQRMRAQLAKAEVPVVGVRTEEPQQDGTPHWHIANYYRDNEDLNAIIRATLTQFPEGLRIRRGQWNEQRRKLEFAIEHYDSLADFEAGRKLTGRAAKHAPAQCQIDIGAEGPGAASMASYMLKYVIKSIGYELDAGADSAGKQKQASADAVRRHRQTYGIRGVQWFGLPKGWATGWKLLRKVRLDGSVAVPEAVQSMAALCQRDKGGGMLEYLRSLGGLALAPVEAARTVETVRTRVRNKYGEPATQIRGVSVDGQERILAGNREIVERSAAMAIRSQVVDLAGVTVSIKYTSPASAGTLTDATAAQQRAIEAPVGETHAVLAAAGAGKTHVLVQRVKHLLKKRVKAHEIALVSFTRDAAGELRKRLDAAGLEAIEVGTTHSLAARWLRGKRVPADYDRLIAESTEQGRQKRHLLVDEAQDWSAEQWAWAHAHAKAIFAVGDGRQSIYKWRNASEAGLTELAASSVFHLPHNRRSGAAIVELGNAIAGAAVPAMATKEGGEIELHMHAHSKAEQKRVVETCAADPAAVVLARTRKEVAWLRATLKVAGLENEVRTVHSAKGLEWAHVVLACGQRKKAEEQEAAETYYVACTRAVERLTITSTGRPPAPLAAAFRNA